ncbi:MAG: RebB family R body protein [Nannocystaceae bacterium]|nr:RebB family R body protein [Nannocystaceae bacterium]
MADSSSTSNFANPVLNPQVTDQVTTTNATVLGEAPAMAMGSLYQTIGNSVAMAAANAVYAQQQANVTYQTATTVAVKKLIGS